MANCVYCGTWAGVASEKHDGCEKMAAEGKSPEEIKRILHISDTPAKDATRRPLTATGVFWAVFFALWLFSITGGILWAIISLIRSAP